MLLSDNNDRLFTPTVREAFVTSVTECTMAHRKYGMSYQLNDETLEDHLAYAFKQQHGLIYTRGGQGAADMSVILADKSQLNLQIKGLRIQPKKLKRSTAFRIAGPRISRVAKEAGDSYTGSSSSVLDKHTHIATHVGEALRTEHEKTDQYVIVSRMDVEDGVRIKIYTADKTSPIYFDNNYDLEAIKKSKTWNYYPKNQFHGCGKTTQAVVQVQLAHQWWIFSSISDFEKEWPGVTKHLDIIV